MGNENFSPESSGSDQMGEPKGARKRSSIARPEGRPFPGRKPPLPVEVSSRAQTNQTDLKEEKAFDSVWKGPAVDDDFLWKLVRALGVLGVIVALILTISFWRMSKTTAPADESGPELASNTSYGQISNYAFHEINEALAELNAGKAAPALRRLQDLQEKDSTTPSLNYLVALAALEAGDFELADRQAVESISRKERVSEALALRAVLQTISPQKVFGDPRLRAQEILEQAIASDSADAVPMIGLARLLRSRGKSDEALKLLEAARNRLQPADSTIAVNISIELIKLQALSDEDLPSNTPSSQDVAEVVGAAYAAMRRGEFGQSAALLRLSREQLPDDLFNHILHDPAIFRFSDEPRLAEFFRNK